MSYLDDAMRFIAEFEGCRRIPYRDSVGVLTVGYGHTADIEDRTYTLTECEEMLRNDVKQFDTELEHLVRVPLTHNQRVALLSFIFNVGSSALAHSTLLRYLNAGDYEAAGNQLKRWDRAGGSTLAGLTRRRLAETALWFKEGDDESTELA